MATSSYLVTTALCHIRCPPGISSATTTTTVRRKSPLAFHFRWQSLAAALEVAQPLLSVLPVPAAVAVAVRVPFSRSHARSRSHPA